MIILDEYTPSNDGEEICSCQNCSCQECTCGQCECQEEEEVITEEEEVS